MFIKPQSDQINLTVANLFTGYPIIG